MPPPLPAWCWPHVLGDFRLAVPTAVFAKYLRPEWKAVFTAG
jgi:hypothetical protein